MHYYEFNIKTFQAATAHLTNEEEIAYRRLLDMYYDLEGPLPSANPVLTRRLRVGTPELETVLNEFFVLTEEGWRNAYCDEVIAKYHAFMDRQKRNGALGGRGRKPSANPVLTQCNPNAKPTNNQQPTTNNKYKESVSDKSDVAPKKSVFREDAENILEFLNTKTGRTYRPVPANIDFITARLKEGATFQDCKCVIAKKCRDWLPDEKMRAYLRPATLFNKTKFAQYHGELVKTGEDHASMS